MPYGLDKQQEERTEWLRQGLRQKNTTSIEIAVKCCWSLEIILPQPAASDVQQRADLADNDGRTYLCGARPKVSEKLFISTSPVYLQLAFQQEEMSQPVY